MEMHIAKMRMEELEWYISKHCLWQYNSRGWDRVNQNEHILNKTKLLLCDEPANVDDTTADRYYWSEAMTLKDAFHRYFPWLNSIPKTDIVQLIDMLKEKLDHVMINASLNQELTKAQY